MWIAGLRDDTSAVTSDGSATGVVTMGALRTACLARTSGKATRGTGLRDGILAIETDGGGVLAVSAGACTAGCLLRR